MMEGDCISKRHVDHRPHTGANLVKKFVTLMSRRSAASLQARVCNLYQRWQQESDPVSVSCLSTQHGL
ncbi:hypothetical protein TNCV_550031 [Trichonephila clavipes]|nr:hypothetical protein TNCV_550031 [Trichonephila clavipes]